MYLALFSSLCFMHWHIWITKVQKTCLGFPVVPLLGPDLWIDISMLRNVVLFSTSRGPWLTAETHRCVSQYICTSNLKKKDSWSFQTFLLVNHLFINCYIFLRKVNFKLLKKCNTENVGKQTKYTVVQYVQETSEMASKWHQMYHYK